MKQQTLHIDPEFKAQIPPLTEDERKQLEENILADGEILSPILVWNDTIVDGHNRYEILQSHPEIPYNVRSLYLETREQVLAWICKNQLGRRNLTPEQKKFLIEKQYDAEKQAEGFHGNQHTVPAVSAGVQNAAQPERRPFYALQQNVSAAGSRDGSGPLSFDILRESAGEHPGPAGRQHTAGPASRRGGGISCGSHPSPGG